MPASIAEMHIGAVIWSWAELCNVIYIDSDFFELPVAPVFAENEVWHNLLFGMIPRWSWKSFNGNFPVRVDGIAFHVCSVAAGESHHAIAVIRMVPGQHFDRCVIGKQRQLLHGNGSKWAVMATDPSGPVATM